MLESTTSHQVLYFVDLQQLLLALQYLFGTIVDPEPENMGCAIETVDNHSLLVWLGISLGQKLAIRDQSRAKPSEKSAFEGRLFLYAETFAT